MNRTRDLFKILILGGYGTFGSRITKALSLKGYQVIINGRNQEKATTLQDSIHHSQKDALVSTACFDVYNELKSQLRTLKPNLVIHTCGPFQGQDTTIAELIIQAKCHYIDLSDGRNHVYKMLEMNHAAQTQNVVAITAASTVPSLSSAALLYLQKRFNIQTFKKVKIGISPGQKTARGVATTQGVLSYIGKRLPTWRGNQGQHYGWQHLYYQKYPNIKNRLMGNCEAPDLDHLQDYFIIDKLQFSAGMESKLLHLLIWLSSWLIRLKLPLNLAAKAGFLLKLSRWFDRLGTKDGGMHIEFTGHTQDKKEINKTWFIEAKNNDGPQIPAKPAVILTEKIFNNQIPTGVRPCINLITLEEYLDELNDLEIQTTLS